MDIRYQHPQVTTLWSRPWTYTAWWKIEQAIIKAQVDSRVIGAVGQVESIPLWSSPVQPSFCAGGETLDDIAALEHETKHDVAAFVKYMRTWFGKPHDKWIHFGVTSSDLVDTAQGMRFKAMLPTLNAYLAGLRGALQPWTEDKTIVLGRTHGQPAEPTTMGLRAQHWARPVLDNMYGLLQLTKELQVAKVAGPVGTYAHNPPVVERAVAETLGLIPQRVGASQIVPRGTLAAWANAAAQIVHACAKIAMDLRLMNLLGEAFEPKTEGQVGSSSMAHKNNPIRAEQITGLARVAQGYATMLQPLDLWLERDISNSSVERIAVPDLWHVLLQVIEQTTLLLTNMKVDAKLAEYSLADHANSAYVAYNTCAAIQEGMDADEAREYALDFDMESYDMLGDVRERFLCNHPRTMLDSKP